MVCRQCPRECQIDRHGESYGFCASPDAFLVARTGLHAWEEPPISGTRGSGTVFFGGCNLRCVFCQNRAISHGGVGRKMDDGALIDAMLRLQDAGAHNINLVTPSHYTLQLVRLLERARPLLHIPVVWNSSAYESVDSLRALDGLVDVYLPDVKYFSPAVSAAYSSAPDYYAVAVRAISEMLRQVGDARLYSDEGILLRGMILRHLILPGCRADSFDLLESLAKKFGTDAFLLSLMGQYTPEFAEDAPYPNLHRRLTSFEYQSVQNLANNLGFDGFSQDLTSATSKYTPEF